jgi:amino acid permease
VGRKEKRGGGTGWSLIAILCANAASGGTWYLVLVPQVVKCTCLLCAVCLCVCQSHARHEADIAQHVTVLFYKRMKHEVESAALMPWPRSRAHSE